jgi:hypothetical protein
VGDWVTVTLKRRSGGEIWATNIVKVKSETFQFSGRVDSINGSTWTVAGHTFDVTGDTDMTGDPGVGDYVDVEVIRQPDGTLVATLVSLVPPTPSPTDIVTPTNTPEPPTPTDTPEPPTPTDTALPPAPTDTPIPSSPAPPDTPTPEPSSPTPASQDPNTPQPVPVPAANVIAAF